MTSPNLKAFLDMIAFSEIGPTLLAASDNGYDVLVGGTLFHGYADHPRVLVWLRDHGYRYTHLASQRADLETVFLTLTGRSVRNA